jgi:hypothetical protein
MVDELERNPPPYIVLDSEFELSREPNDSSKRISTERNLRDDVCMAETQPLIKDSSKCMYPSFVLWTIVEPDFLADWSPGGSI